MGGGFTLRVKGGEMLVFQEDRYGVATCLFFRIESLEKNPLPPDVLEDDNWCFQNMCSSVTAPTIKPFIWPFTCLDVISNIGRDNSGFSDGSSFTILEPRTMLRSVLFQAQYTFGA